MSLFAVAALATAGTSRAADVAAVEIAGGVLAVQPRASADSISVRLSGPNGYSLTRTFGRGESPALDLGESRLTDGLYFWEVRLNPPARQRAAARRPAGGRRPPQRRAGPAGGDGRGGQRQ